MRKLVNFFWPRLEGEPSRYTNFLAKNAAVDKNNLDDTLEFAKLMYQQEKERVSTIESKSMIYVGFFGAVIAIFAFMMKDLLMIENKTTLHIVALFFGGIVSIYILQIMSYSIKAMERMSYESLDASDFLTKSKQASIISIINMTKKNYDTINLKVDYMVMAHEFTKRLIWILLFLSGSLVAYSGFYFLDVDYILALTQGLEIGRYDIFLILLLIGLIYSFYKIHRIEKSVKDIQNQD